MVRVTVHKPEAPIPLPFADVRSRPSSAHATADSMNRRLAEGFTGDVEPTRTAAPVEAVVALGSNLGDRAATLAAASRTCAAAARRRRARVGCRRVGGASSPMVRMPTPRRTSTPSRIVTTRLAPSVLLGYLQAIEDATRPASGGSAGAIARSTSTSSRSATCVSTRPTV